MTVEVMEAALPPRLGALSRKEKPLHPYAAVVVGAAGTGVGCCRRPRAVPLPAAAPHCRTCTRPAPNAPGCLSGGFLCRVLR